MKPSVKVALVNVAISIAISLIFFILKKIIYGIK